MPIKGFGAMGSLVTDEDGVIQGDITDGVTVSEDYRLTNHNQKASPIKQERQIDS